ncbi:hypothetical protein ACUXFU_001777 [Staphylococcus saprophyticus]
MGNDKQEKLVNETLAIPVENDYTQANDEKNTNNTSIHTEQQSDQTKAIDNKNTVDPEYNQADKNKLTENTDTLSTERPSPNKEAAVTTDKSGLSFDKLNGEKVATTNSDDERKDNQDKSLKALKESAVATPKNQTQQAVNKTAEQPNKTAKQGQYKKQDPIILVHGFNGFTDDINPSVLSHYWGGDKLDIRQDLESNGYETYEASIGALSSNYDRAVELY